MPTTAPSSRAWLWLPLLLLGSLTLSLAWLMVALAVTGHAGWMAVAAALEAACMLRLGGFRPGLPRVAVALLATLLIALAANFLIAAAWIGGPMGLAPWESTLRLGPHLAWTLIGLANGVTEIVWLLVGLVVAWRVAK